MNQLSGQFKRYFLFSFLIFLRLLARIGSGLKLIYLLKIILSLTFTGFKWILNLVLANIKLVSLFFVIFLSWQFFISINSFLNSLPKINAYILNNLSVPPLISIYDQNDNLLARANRDYYQIPINLSQISIPVLKDQKDAYVYSQKLADRLLSGQFGIRRSITRDILAFKIRGMFSRDQILTAFLNTLTFPDHIIGVEAASEYFLGKNASRLSSGDYQTLVRFNLNQESPKLKFPLYQRAPDSVNFVLAEFKIRYPEIWKSNQEIKILTSIDLKLQNYLQQFVLENMLATNVTNLAIVDTRSHQLLALVGRPGDSNKLQAFSSIKRVTDLKQNILVQNNQEMTSSSLSIISLNPGENDKNLLNKLTKNLPAEALDNHLVTTKLEGR